MQSVNMAWNSLFKSQSTVINHSPVSQQKNPYEVKIIMWARYLHNESHYEGFFNNIVCISIHVCEIFVRLVSFLSLFS